MPRRRYDSNYYLYLLHSAAILFGSAACLASGGAQAQSRTANAADPFKIFVADRYSYEENLFRVADPLLQTDNPSLVNVQSFDDYVNRLSAGINARVDASRQAFVLNLRFDDVSYSKNDQLDHHGGSGDLKWNFDIGRHWSGLIDAKYDRGQAGFSNYLLFVKDIVESETYLGELRFKIGSRWALLGAASIMESSHSAPERRTSNFESETGRVGVEYMTPNQSLLAVEYAYTEATFPVAEQIFARGVGFEQTLPGIRAAYVFSEKTRITGRAGYLKRDYVNPVAGDYSGNVWKINAYWEPRAQYYVELEAWHELKAYVDAEADYFVATGVSLTPTWAPTPLMKFALSLQTEDQSYRRAATEFQVTEEGREDDVQSVGLLWDYTPRDFISLSLGYRWLDRSSNRAVRANEAEVASAQVRVAF
jgi:hypothetical protein